MNPERIYVETNVTFSREGRMTPVKICWEDGREFEIDRVLDVKRAVSEAGSGGLRYTVRIMGRERRLFFEDTMFETNRPRWFVEK